MANSARAKSANARAFSSGKNIFFFVLRRTVGERVEFPRKLRATFVLFITNKLLGALSDRTDNVRGRGKTIYFVF